MVKKVAKKEVEKKETKIYLKKCKECGALCNKYPLRQPLCEKCESTKGCKIIEVAKLPKDTIVVYPKEYVGEISNKLSTETKKCEECGAEMPKYPVFEKLCEKCKEKNYGGTADALDQAKKTAKFDVDGIDEFGLNPDISFYEFTRFVHKNKPTLMHANKITELGLNLQFSGTKLEWEINGIKLSRRNFRSQNIIINF